MTPLQVWRRQAGGLAAAILLALALLPSLAQAALFERSSLDLQAEARAAGGEKKLLAVFLSLPDCAGCQEMVRHLFADPATQSKAGKRFRTVYLDISRNETLIDPAGRQTTPGDFARRLRAFATPSLVFFDGQSQVLYRHTGTLDATGFANLLGFVERAEYEERPFVPPASQQRAKQSLFADPPAANLPHRPDFRLAATDGQQRSPADFRGKAIALAVGYTTCPDVCPTTLLELQSAVQSLPASQRNKVQVLFATLDPERDSLDMLRQYADAFRPKGGLPILGLRGDAKQTAQLIRQLQLVADKRPSDSMGYTLDHTAGVFLFDTRGRLLGLSPYGQPVDKLANDLATATRLP